MKIYFSKMHGLGNDFVVIDAINQSIKLNGDQIKFMGDRHFGIGFDQLLLVEKAVRDSADFKYRIFNADGGEVAQCGNGRVVSPGLYAKKNYAIRMKSL